jgi:hypothetical protein
LLRWEWLGVLARLVAAGATIALGYRMVTAGVIGANIGFGIFLMLGIPFCLGLVVWAALIAHTLTARQVGPADRQADGRGKSVVDRIAP